MVDNKLIAKNSIFLYIRTIVLTLIALYTSRVVLNALGESNYGVYNVVGGAVVFFSFINSALSSSTQRYFNVAMGSGNESELRKVFRTSMQIHMGICVIIVFLSETIGLWFMNTCLNIPPQAKTAANWVFQFSVINMVVSTLSTPYNAAIISHERMSIFAYFSLIEGMLKLVVAFIIAVMPSSRLVLYAVLLCVVSLVVRSMYNFYCKRHFEECRSMGKGFDLKQIKEMSVFSGWSLFGSVGFLAQTQGMSFIVNIFFGVVLNAALAIANQVNTACYQTIYGFLQAIRPQIMKSYAAGQLHETTLLVLRGSRLAVLLTALFVIPVYIEAPAILGLWLKEVPEYTCALSRIMLILSLINSPLLILVAAKEATGNIKSFQLVAISASGLALLISWILYRMGYNPTMGFAINLILGFVAQILRVIFIHQNIGMSYSAFVRDIVVRCGICIVLGFCTGYFLKEHLSQSILHSFIIMAVSLIVTALASLFIGLKSNERNKILTAIIKQVHI